MGLVLNTAPALEPLTAAEVRAHLRLGTGGAELAPDAPTVALAGSGAGNVENGAHRYRVTFVTADGETEGGTVSSAVTVADKTANGKVALTAIPLGGTGVTSRKVYRTAAGGSTYLLLTTLADNTSTTYTDNTADSALGAGAPSVNSTLDPQLAALVTAARQHVEELTRRALLAQTWVLTLDEFPAEPELLLPRPTLRTVTSITYVDGAGDTQTLGADVYSVDTASFPGAVRLKFGQVWPSTRAQPNAVTVTYTAGYGTARADVPAPIKQAMLLLIGDWYAVREAAIVGTIRTENPAVRALLGPYRHLEAA